MLWKQPRLARGYSFADGWAVHRLWLGPGRHALGVIGKRLYFHPETGKRDTRQEHLIVAGKRPAPPSPPEQLQSQRAAIDVLLSASRSSAKPVALEPVAMDLTDARRVVIGDSTHCVPPSNLNTLYKDAGFDEVPMGCAVRICPVDGVAMRSAQEFAARFERAAAARHAPMQVRVVSRDNIQERLNALADTSAPPEQGRCVLFLMPDKQQIPATDTLTLFTQMEACGVPFRRAYMTDPHTYSIPDQIPSVLMAAGGRPHSSPLCIKDDPIWMVGVDLAHFPGQPESRLVVTLIDAEGRLAGAWVRAQRRDETARWATLRPLLEACRARMQALAHDRPIVVLRDGRRFENEHEQDYRRILGKGMAFLEFRKRHNPQMLAGCDPALPVAAPAACMLPGCNTLFVSLAPPKDARTLPAIARVTWNTSHGGPHLTPEEIARLLAAAAAAPGLGLHPHHLPAPIYWADGIAGQSTSDLRFAGTPRVVV